MNDNLTQSLTTDSKEIQNMISQAMVDAVRSLPRPQLPSWMDSMGNYVKAHPWVSLLIVFFILFVISAIIREIICSYFKTNEILSRLKRLEEKLK